MADDTKQLPVKGYRTLYICATLLTAILASPDIQQLISTYPKSFGSFMVFVTVACRVITSTPIFNKEQS